LLGSKRKFRLEPLLTIERRTWLQFGSSAHCSQWHSCPRKPVPNRVPRVSEKTKGKMHWLWVPEEVNVLLAASERQSGWF
jgi:hypothetical protein